MLNNNRIAECRKFSPNIFNKKKCSHCFGAKEEHSPSALDYNRASRKISKCGYLFVAPDWDFTNPLYRTKRWQRRWFVLFDDGELTYAVDEHPETIPQASMNMTDVIEVADAEQITGHTHSILVQTTDRSTFVKGTCPEESKWWYNSLITLVKSKVRHKRNAFLKGQSQIYYIDQPISSKSPPTRDKLQPENKAHVRGRLRETDSTDSPSLYYDEVIRDEKLKEIANKITNITTAQEKERNARWTTSEVQMDEKPTRDEIITKQKRPQSLSIITSSATAIVTAVLKKKSAPPEILNYQKRSQSHERGDPDGDCGMEESPIFYCNKSSEVRVKLPAEEILNCKSGWLMKEDLNGEWSKYWFSLKGGGLFYYRDPSAEERGVLDGVLDVNSITSIKEINTNRNHAFQLTTWDTKRIILSSVTSNVKNNWMNALRNASGLVEPHQTIDEHNNISSSSNNNNNNNNNNINNNIHNNINNKNNNNNSNSDLITSTGQNNNNNSRSLNKLDSTYNQEETGTSAEKKAKHSLSSSPGTPLTLLTGRSILFSSDEEYKTASEGRRESIDWGSPLSPSNPIQNTLLYTKESKFRSNLRNSLHKRSLSSPPNSRRSTIESAEDFANIPSVQEECTMNVSSNESELNLRLSTADRKLLLMQDEARERDTRMAELLETLEKTEMELTARRQESKEMKEKMMSEIMENRESAKNIINKLQEDLVESKEKLSELDDQLQRGIEENDSLYRKLRTLEVTVPSSSSTTSLNRSTNSDRIRRMNSFSDLTCLNDVDPDELDKESLVGEYQELKQRFEKVVNELKMMKRELRESYNSYDNLDIAFTSLRQEFERKQNENHSRSKMMADRIQDLTNKYSSAEKQVRILKQKLMKSERKRTLSLKGKETLQLQRELEDKVIELESKFDINIDGEINSPNYSLRASPARCDTPDKKSNTKLRRKSLDSVSSQPMQLLVRLNALEKKIESNSSNLSTSTIASDTNQNIKSSDNLIDRVRNLENVIISCRDVMEEGLQQLHQYNKCSRSRCTETFKVEQMLVEGVKLLRDSFDNCCLTDHLSSKVVCNDEIIESSSVKTALLQLESQLKVKLSELLKQRRILRETNKLTHKKDLELLAERVAFESVCFGKLRDSLSRADKFEKFVEHQTKCEIAETTQLMALLKAKLCGKASVKTNGSLDVLSQVLARRLLLTASKLGQINDGSENMSKFPAVTDVNFMEDLLRQQNELNIMTKRYKCNTIENLAYDLAAETINYISANTTVQGAVQEAWRFAQETVNSELIQYEISHIMKKTATRYENSLSPSFGFALTSQERISFEMFADAVQDSLRNEMEATIAQLTQCYEENLTKMKQGQWRLHLEQERKASEGRQLLIEFADIIAQKALIDARISVIRGDQMNVNNLLVEQEPTNEKEKEKKSFYSIASMQKYENLFMDLSEDMDISNTDDILAEADFNFMFKTFSFGFSVNKQEMNDLSNVIIKLEELLLLLHNKMNPNININHIQNLNLDNIKNISIKLNEFYQTAETVLYAVDKLQSSPCSDCDKIHETLLEITNHHDEELDDVKRKHSTMLLTLNEQIDEHTVLNKQLKYELSHMEHVCLDKTTHNNELVQQLNDSNEKYWHFKEKVEELNDRLRDEKQKVSEVETNYELLYEQFNREQEICKKMENKLELIELDHSEKTDQLHQYYQTRLSGEQSEKERPEDEEELRQKYQNEIEQLRTLCEKGLSAMESSHKRIVTDLELKNRVEIQRLLGEKETALAEETQATLQALESMRKAHQNEVQREVSRFKQEFIRKFNSDNKEQLESLALYKEEKELEEVRQEILSLSEKYSLKCVETISLEEKLRISQQKLKHAQQTIQKMDLRSQLARTDHDDTEMCELNESFRSEKCPIKTEIGQIRDDPKKTMLNLPLIPIIKVKTELHPRFKLNEGSKFGYSPSPNRDEVNSEHSSTPLDSIKEIEGKKRHSFELEI